jgi:hypothetical protein
MSSTTLYLWDRTKQKAGSAFTLDRSKIRQNKNGNPDIRLRYNKQGAANVEGTVVTMQDGTEFTLANNPAEVRRALGVVEAEPKGSAAKPV